MFHSHLLRRFLMLALDFNLIINADGKMTEATRLRSSSFIHGLESHCFYIKFHFRIFVWSDSCLKLEFNLYL